MCLAVPGKLADISGEGLQRCGRVDFGGVFKEANLSCLAEAKVGDYVLVHAGIALSIVDPDEAGKIFEYLRQMRGLDEVKNG
jgi:hydrogenase expression/formation protein HypC